MGGLLLEVPEPLRAVPVVSDRLSYVVHPFRRQGRAGTTQSTQQNIAEEDGRARAADLLVKFARIGGVVVSW